MREDPRERLTFSEFVSAYPNVLRAASVAVFLVVWEVFGRQMNPLFMTYPSAIFEAGVQLFLSGELVKATLQSLIPFSIGMAISIVFGVAIGLAIGLSRTVEYIIDPYVNALNAIPRIALVPLIILWFGLGISAKVVIVVSIAIFPIIINTYSGVRDVRGSLLDVAKVYTATNWQTLYKVIIPAAVPFVMAGIRVGVALGIIGMIVAEFFTAISGLGGVIVKYGNTFQTAKMFAAIIVVGAMGVLFSEIAMLLERHWTRWRRSEQQRD